VGGDGRRSERGYPSWSHAPAHLASTCGACFPSKYQLAHLACLRWSCSPQHSVGHSPEFPPLPSSGSSMSSGDTPSFFSRLWEKTKRDPLVPIGRSRCVLRGTRDLRRFGSKHALLSGCTATLACLTAGLYAFKTGQVRVSGSLILVRGLPEDRWRNHPEHFLDDRLALIHLK
jgi:hypothetical protein